ncbi:MAG: M24 family metallopeptidase, partial [Nocardioidaceae bacterium]
PDVERVIDRDLLAAMAALLEGDAAVGLETHDLSVDAHADLVGRLDERGIASTSVGRAVEELRVVKDEIEIGALRSACEISTAALEEIHAGPLVGRTEREIARDLEWRMYAHGAEAVGFETIVAGGPNSAIPHHSPTDRVVGSGDLLKIDFGARYDGYHADCTRTVVVGHADDWQREVYDAVRRAQQAGVDALVAGAPVAEPDAKARAVLEEAGWLEAFTTGIGHGVGLQIHEDPFIAKSNTGTLRPRTALTMEPGIYVAGRGGVRIEDTLVVTAGHPDVLTAATKNLLELA